MNVTQLEYFCAVCTYQSISEAAEHLHISQPSLSVAIKELETEYGVLLFKRHYRGVSLTEAGEQLYEMSSRLLKEFKNLEQKIYDIGKKRKVLEVGIPPMIGSLFLPRIYKEFLKDNEDITLQVSEGGTKKILKALKDDGLDMVLIPHTKPLEKELEAMEISRFEVVCGMAGENAPEKKEISLSELAGKPLVLLNNSFFQTEEILRRFSQEGVTPQVILQTEQLSTLQNMIKSGEAAGFLFRELIENQEGIQAVPLVPPIFVTVSLVFKKDSYMSESMENFCTFIKNTFSQKG